LSGGARAANGWSNWSSIHQPAYAGLGRLVEGQRISYQLERGQQGKTSAVDLQAA